MAAASTVNATSASRRTLRGITVCIVLPLPTLSNPSQEQFDKLDVVTGDARRYFGTVPVTLVLMPMLTLLRNRKPSLRIATDEKSDCVVLAVGTSVVF